MHLRAALILFVYAAIFILATPGLDFMSRGELSTDAQKDELRDQIGPSAEIGIAIAELNRRLRMPLVDLLTPLQRPFRIEQTWNFYQDGPDELQKLEIRIRRAGGWELAHRSLDPEATWLNPQLRSRRLAPLFKASVRTPNAKNWRGLTRFVAQRARADFPDVQAVELRAMHGPFPDGPMTLQHRFLARAPDWEPEKKVPSRQKETSP